MHLIWNCTRKKIYKRSLAKSPSTNTVFLIDHQIFCNTYLLTSFSARAFLWMGIVVLYNYILHTYS